MLVYNPEGFDPKDCLPHPLHAYSDCARVLVHLVETARVFNKLQVSAFVPRKAQYLRRLVHKEMYLPIRDALVGSGVLDWHPHYVVGKQSYGFRIGEKFKGAIFRHYRLTDRGAIRRVQRVRAEQSPPLTDATLEGLKIWLNRLEVDFTRAWAFLRDLSLSFDSLRQRHLSLSMIRDQEFFFEPDLHGRVHTNLTNLWSGFRPFLCFQGQSLVNIDISNSQPLFFGFVVSNRIKNGMKIEYNNNVFIPSSSLSPLHYDAESIRGKFSSPASDDSPEDVKRYLQITEKAELYEHMMAAMGIPITKECRDGFKHDFFGKVFYCKANYYTKERRAFQAEFPTVLDHITMLKKDDPRNAPLALQRAEGDFVIGTVCKRILEESPETPLWTIHDSITTTASRGEFVKQVMEEEFAKLGIHPRLRVEGFAGEPAEAAATPSQRVLVAFSEVGRDLMSDDPTTHRLHSHEYGSYGTAV